MLAITDSLVRLGLEATDKEDAIRKTAAILIDAGSVDAGYANSMLGRERQVPTYLGSGIAIPHGMREDAGMVHRTAVAVAQFPKGVRWNEGEIVYLAVGIAAASDEHIRVLANLTSVLQDDGIATRLAHTSDPQDIMRALNGAETVSAPAALPDGYAHVTEAVVADATGFHARPATLFAGLAKQFAADILVGCNGKLANGKAMAALLTLGAEHGAVLTIAGKGVDAEAAVRTLAAALAAGFDKEEPAAALVAEPYAQLAFQGDVLRGVAASPGIVLAPSFLLQRKALTVSDAPSGEPAAEEARLRSALAAAHEELRGLHASVAARSGSKQAAIFLAHQELVDDPDMVQAAVTRIGQGASAARAWADVTEARAAEMERLRDATLAERAKDFRDVGVRVQRLLVGDRASASLDLPDHKVVLIAEDLAPSDTASLDPERVCGILTALGGPNSHTAILARGLGLPAVVGIGEVVLHVPDGTELILDGSGGAVVLAPSETDRRLAEAARDTFMRATELAARDAFRPAVTRDGRRLETVANIGNAADAARAVTVGAEGIGLLRTEFLFLDRDTAPDEEEQFQALHTMTQALNGLPLVVRTLDIGGDKNLPYLRLAHEDNPFLGIRGLRLCLQRPDLFQPQLRAIVRAARAAPAGAVKVMFPMVTTIEEYREGRALLEQVRHDLNGPPIECGIMVEVPAAAMMADVLAREVDFFSIGTNDLTQYVLAMDRLHPGLATKADALHPAVLRMIHQVVEAAHGAGRWVGICGNLAAEAAACAILVGLGVDELSVSPPSVPELKARIRAMSMQDARRLATRALTCATAAEVRALR